MALDCRWPSQQHAIGPRHCTWYMVPLQALGVLLCLVAQALRAARSCFVSGSTGAKCTMHASDTLAEWLRRWPAKPMG